MQVIIDIPDEFVADWNKDRFDDALHRLSADAHLIAGNYEQETAKMLADAFKNAVEPDPDTVSRQAVIEINQSYHGQMPNEVNHRIWKEINELPSTQPELYGFTLEYLILFALTCRKAGIENRDLKNFMMNTKLIYEVVRKDFEAQMKEAIATIFKEDR